MARINDIQISENFQLREFECRCCGSVKIDPDLLLKLQKMRDYLDAPLIITSGYRCPAHNRTVGGVSKSEHLTGRAADISLENHPTILAEEMIRIARNFGFNGLGIYDSPIIHVDTRANPAEWDWRKED